MLTCYLQNDSSSTEFYSRTTAALDKQKASDRETAQQLQEAKDAANMHEPVGFQPPQKPIGVDTPKVAPNHDRPEVATSSDLNGKKSVAGRKTMKGTDFQGLHMGKLAPKETQVAADNKAQDEDEIAGKEEIVKSKEDQEIEIELNTILKKGPSESLVTTTPAEDETLSSTNDTYLCSHSFQQILLSPFCQGQTNTPRKIHHRACSLCC